MSGPPATSPAVSLATPLSQLPWIRPPQLEALKRLELGTVADLIRHTPMRYERIEAESDITALVPGQNITARGTVMSTRPVPRGRKPRFEAVLADHTGRLDVIWFNQPFLADKILPGMRIRVVGKARRFGPGGRHIQLANPSWHLLPDQGEEPAAADVSVRPVYPAGEAITSAQIQRIIQRVIEPALAQIDDHLPEEFRRAKEMPALRDAYRMVHAPDSLEHAEEGRRRLAYDELLLLQLGVFLRRAQLSKGMRAFPLRHSAAIDEHIRRRFPFKLTPSQDSVVSELVADLTRPTPAGRLIQGDVGSGKTAVALYAMFMAAGAGHQSALMVPTELLAEQHFASISKMLAGSIVRVALLTGSLDPAARASVLARTASGEIEILIGTHALLTETVRFSSLAVAVIDEQHRFGVHQRANLRDKGTITVAPHSAAAALGDRPVTPHILVMTATPIPRTLAMTLFGDLDVSTIAELPPGRTPIITRVVAPELSGEVYRFVRDRLDAGDQAFVVVPAIDTGASAAPGAGDQETNDLRTVLARLETHEFAGKRLAAMHGRLPSAERDAIMDRFRDGQIDALVSTIVIEVGVDIPNATVMVVEHAERFGLAQLHQLRGRVGRGAKPSLCILIGEALTPEARARLEAIGSSADGFVLAERDLEIRGPGEVFGTRQTGAPPFRTADLMRDRELLLMARRDAAAWVERSPTLSAPDESLLRRRLLKAHGKWLGLGDVG